MAKTLQELQRTYAQMLLHCIGMPGNPRPIFVSTHVDPNATAFVAIFADEALRAGAPIFDVSYTDPLVNRARYLHAPEDKKVFFPPYVTQRAQDTVDVNGANVALYGNADLGVYDGIDPKYPSDERSKFFAARKPFHYRQVRYLSPWLVGGVATEAWARKLGVSIDALWSLIFQVTGADQEDPIGYLDGVVVALKHRTRLLNGLRFRSIYFRGPRTELHVGLSEHARWLGGAKQAEDGMWFTPNCPTYEIFTTPDWREVSGYLTMTMPGVVSGNLVRNLRLEFRDGEIVNVAADEGADVYAKLIETDGGARRLGEVALVGLDSPIARTKTLFYSTLQDENAACHVATGSAYVGALDGGPSMTPEQLADVGCNKSDTHNDIMISDKDTDVFAICADGQHVELIKKGWWAPVFA